jgi:biotin transporter BioY
MKKIIIYWISFIIGFIFAVFIISFIAMTLWNLLFPEIFNLPKITFFQALGIMILSKILFSPGYKDFNNNFNKNFLEKEKRE